MARGGRGAPQSRFVRQDVRWFSAAILVTCVTVISFGLAMGLYLDGAPDGPPAPASSAGDALTPLPVAAVDTSSTADAIAASPSSPATPAVEPRAVPPVQSPLAETNLAAEPAATVAPPHAAAEAAPTLAAGHPAAIEPQSGTSAAELASELRVALTATMAVPAPTHHSAAARYWVEYAVFVRERSAEHLRETLAALHVEARVVATHAPDGRRLWRVRSSTAPRASAEADARLARQRLSLEPLIHHAAPTRVRRAQYWVQFGAFPTIAPAVRLQQVLADNGVKASVRNTRTSAGKPLFFVRSDGFPNRRLAVLVGELGGSAAKVAFLVGRSSPSRQATGHRSSARGAVGSSVPHPSRVPRPGGG